MGGEAYDKARQAVNRGKQSKNAAVRKASQTVGKLDIGNAVEWLRKKGAKVLIPLLALSVLVFGAGFGALTTLANKSKTDALVTGGGYETHPETNQVLGEELVMAQKAAGLDNDLPWTVLAAVAATATEGGRFSPYPDDLVDRRPGEPGIRRASAPTGDSSSTPPSTIPAPTPATAGGPVAVIGDSYCEPGSGAAKVLTDALAATGSQPTLDCVRGRPLSAWNGKGGVEVIQAQATSLPQTVVVALGTNDAQGGNGAAFSTNMETALGALGTKRVVWVNVGSKQPGRTAINAAIAQTAAKHQNVTVVDWAATTDANPDLVAADNVHLTSAGYSRRAQMVAQAVGATGGSVTMASGTFPPNPPDLKVDTYPAVTPPIGGKDRQGVGPYLLRAGPAQAAEVDAQDVSYESAANPKTATEFVASALERNKDRLEDDGWEFGGDTDGMAAWAEAVRRLPVVNPKNADCVPPTLNPGADQNQVRVATAQHIRAVWECETQSVVLHTVSGVSSDGTARELDPIDAPQVVINEALAVAWEFSGWGTKACDNAAAVAGVFPLTEATFDEFATDKTKGRCDTDANVRAAARAFVAGETVNPAERPADGGPYAVAFGGWAKIPWAIGDTNAARFAADGVHVPWVPEAECLAELDAWAAELGADDTIDTAALTAEQAKALLDTAPACGDDADRNAVLRAAIIRLQYAAAVAAPIDDTTVLPDPGPDAPRDEGRQSTTTTPTTSTTVAGDTPESAPDPARLTKIAERATEALEEDAYQPGKNSAIARLSGDGILPAETPQLTDSGVNSDWANTVVQVARLLGGLEPGGDGFDPGADPWAPILQLLGPLGGTASLGIGGSVPGISDIALAAYQKGAQIINQRDAACGMQWWVLAGFGKIESGHGTFKGAQLDQAGNSNPPIIGPELNGGKFAAIRDTDDGVYDGNPVWDHAVGPMQFIPGTWKGYGEDANGDGKIDPQNYFDATVAAGKLLCANRGGMRIDTREGLLKGAFAYNRSRPYGIQVADAAFAYSAAVITPAGAAGAISFGPAPGGGTMRSSPGGPICVVNVKGINVNCQIAAQVDALITTARSQGVNLAGGGYRDPAGQIATRRNNCGSSNYAIYEMPSSQCSPPTARPGTSQHESGLAIDFTLNGSILRRGDAGNLWMHANAARFGLINFPVEPWHWSTTGK